MADVDINKFRAQVVRDGFRPSNPGFVESEGQDPVNPPGTNNFVPYSGATDNVELGEFGLEAGFVTLDTTPTNTPTAQGTIFWDADDETVDVILNGYTMKIGEDLFYPVKNQTGSTIAKGTAVRFNGTVGASGRLLIAPFIADGSVASSRFMGVTAEEILNGEDGKVLYFGRIRGINTNAFNEGDILYASTTVAGGYQTAIPVAPNNIVQVAAVVTKSINQGTIFVRPTLGSNINTDEAVKITSVANLDLLQYQSGTALWENKTLAQVIGSAYVPSSRTITINGTTQDLSANRTFNVGTVTSVGLSSATSGVTIGSTPVTTSGTITLAIATASGSQNGLLSSTDWTTFNNKMPAITFNAPLFIASGGEVGITQASGSANGFLSSTDWTTFNNKQNALTNPVTGTGTTNTIPKFTGASTIGNSQVFDNGTSVGIGTAIPTRILDVRAADNGNAALFLFKGANQVVWLGTGSSTAGAASGYLGLYNNSNDIGIQLNAVGNSYITGGNVLVGTTTDNGARLQVSGTATITSNGNSVIAFRINDTNANASFLSFNASNTDAAIIANGTTGIPLDFYTGGSFKMRLTSSGNLGLGVTPSAWTLFTALQISGGAAIAGYLNNTLLSSNYYFASGEKYISNGAASLYQQGGGIHYWYNAPSGTAGNAISFTQAMTLTSGGNLLVGTTTDNGARLQVSGDIKVTIGDIDVDSSTSYIRANNTRIAGTDRKIQVWNNVSAYIDVLTMAATGAATFSSSVTATQFITGGTPSNTAGFTNSFYAESNIPSLTLSNTGTNTGKYTIGVTNGNLGIWNNATSSYPLFINSSNNVLIGTTTSGASKLRIVGLPTSSAGLSSGDVWNDSGTLKIA